MPNLNQRAADNQCWVCFACGRRTKLGGTPAELRDTSCVINAVLCYAERLTDGVWHYTPVDWTDLGSPKSHNRSLH